MTWGHVIGLVLTLALHYWVFIRPGWRKYAHLTVVRDTPDLCTHRRQIPVTLAGTETVVAWICLSCDGTWYADRWVNARDVTEPRPDGPVALWPAEDARRGRTVVLEPGESVTPTRALLRSERRALDGGR